MFVTLEGIDRSGKTTQARMLGEALGAQVVREPGGTEAGERIRALLKDPVADLTPMTELLLFCAARAAAFERWVRPALEADRDVVLDRFVDSTIAYQGIARGLGVDEVVAASAIATGGRNPDLTFLLRIDAKTAWARERDGADRFEAEGLDLQERVAAAYDQIAGWYPDRIHVIDATQEPEAIHQQMLHVVESRR